MNVSARHTDTFLETLTHFKIMPYYYNRNEHKKIEEEAEFAANFLNYFINQRETFEGP